MLWLCNISKPDEGLILPGRLLRVCRPSSLAACLAFVHLEERGWTREGMKMFAKAALDLRFFGWWEVCEWEIDLMVLRVAAAGLIGAVPDGPGLASESLEVV